MKDILSWCVVTGKGRECPICETIPHTLEIEGAFAQRRGTDAFRTLEALTLQAVAREKQILRACLGVDREQTRLGLANVLGCLLGRHVHDQDRNVRELRQSNDTVGGFVLCKRRPRQGMAVGLGPTPRMQFLRHPLDHFRVLGVDHGGHAQAASGLHDFEDLAVAQAQRLIGHVYLDGGDTVTDDNREFVGQNVRGGVGQDEVEAVVTVRDVVRAAVVLFDDGEDALIGAVLACKCQDGGRPPCNGRSSSCFPVVARNEIILR